MSSHVCRVCRTEFPATSTQCPKCGFHVDSEPAGGSRWGGASLTDPSSKQPDRWSGQPTSDPETTTFETQVSGVAPGDIAGMLEQAAAAAPPPAAAMLRGAAASLPADADERMREAIASMPPETAAQVRQAFVSSQQTVDKAAAWQGASVVSPRRGGFWVAFIAVDLLIAGAVAGFVLTRGPSDETSASGTIPGGAVTAPGGGQAGSGRLTNEECERSVTHHLEATLAALGNSKKVSSTFIKASEALGPTSAEYRLLVDLHSHSKISSLAVQGNVGKAMNKAEPLVRKGCRSRPRG